MRVLIRNQSGFSGYQRRLKRDSLFLLKSFHLLKSELSLLLVNDGKMKSLNSTFRRKNVTTDVLSFPLYHSLKEIPEDRESLIGDVVINIETAIKDARKYGISNYEEIRRLLIHGFLHLLGYDHEGSEYQKRKMRRKEKEIYDALKEMDKEC